MRRSACASPPVRSTRPMPSMASRIFDTWLLTGRSQRPRGRDGQAARASRAGVRRGYQCQHGFRPDDLQAEPPDRRRTGAERSFLPDARDGGEPAARCRCDRPRAWRHRIAEKLARDSLSYRSTVDRLHASPRQQGCEPPADRHCGNDRDDATRGIRVLLSGLLSPREHLHRLHRRCRAGGRGRQDRGIFRRLEGARAGTSPSAARTRGIEAWPGWLFLR